ncbi:transcriptional regulator NrdR [Gleimia hominis]|uniref:Transcriptional repressor NrdR n=1 Tax=Gleimia hominis TaxID=595468 RepID=A0ABU3IAZ7_9ACTO|nr:transcriptional regulator NrdR [Gleimia hominis]
MLRNLGYADKLSDVFKAHVVEAHLHCPFCHHEDSRVVDTRLSEDGLAIRRRRECTACGRRFTTQETSNFSVTKRSGVVEPFSREKIISGVAKACQGRPVNERELAKLAQQVEESLRTTGQSTVSADEVGRAILPYLKELDEVAYLRFASVYSNFQSLSDFEQAITALRENREERGR